jgi:hypothetical protein
MAQESSGGKIKARGKAATKPKPAAKGAAKPAAARAAKPATKPAPAPETRLSVAAALLRKNARRVGL